MSENLKSLGERIRKFRLEKKITQAQLGKILGGCGQTHISMIEKGKVGLSYTKLQILADMGIEVFTLKPKRSIYAKTRKA